MSLLKSVIDAIGPLDRGLIERTQKRLDNLTKPQGSLGRLEELARKIAGITGKEDPPFQNKAIFTMAGDHGVTEEGISAFPKEVTPQMVYNFIRGGAGINVLARHVGARVVIADIGVACDLEKHPGLIIKKINYGTKNISRGPAMTKKEAAASIETGIEICLGEFKKGLDIAGTGDMGIGNTTASSAIVSAITGKMAGEITGRGTGIDNDMYDHKIAVIEKALNVNNPDPSDALDVLAKVGGFEIGGITGVILAAASKRIPVVIDGFISGAAALLAYQLQPLTKEYMIAAHCSVEKGHLSVLEHIGLKPLFDFNLRLGEGTGAALGISIAEASIKILIQMATFKNASISERTGRQTAERAGI